MSSEKLRARLDAATDKNEWYPGHNRERKADLIAHAPTDLRLLLDVVEAINGVLDGYDRCWEHLKDRLDAFEAAP